jgi:hypothetical protein
MREILVPAAILAALGMASQVAEARDRGFGFRHFSGHAGPKLHLRHHGFKFHHGGFVGKPRAFKSRHFGHFGHRGFSSKFGHVPRFKPRYFGHFGQRGLVLKFGDGDFVLRFGHLPFKHRHFSHRHHHPGLFFGFDQPRRSGRGTIAALPGGISVSFPVTARACRVRRPARVVGGTAAHRQKPYSNSSSRWAFDMSQSFCAP